MVGHCFSAFHSRKYALCTLNMSQGSMEMQYFLRLSKQIHKGHDTPETKQGASRSNCNLHRKHASYHEKGLVSCKQGKQAEIYQHAQYKAGREELQDVSRFRRRRSIDSVEAASTVYMTLIGDDTDLLILLIYHASLDSCSLFFKPEPKKSIKNSRVCNIHAVKKQLGLDICSQILFLLPSLDATQHYNLMGSEKETL